MITANTTLTPNMMANAFSQAQSKVGQSGNYQGKEGRNFYMNMRKPSGEPAEKEAQTETTPDGHLDITA